MAERSQRRAAPQVSFDYTFDRLLESKLAQVYATETRPWLQGSRLTAWELEKDGREVRVRVDGQLIFNNTQMVLRAARAGFGLAFVMEDQAASALADGSLVRVLEDWSPRFPGYHLYYPSRRQPSAAFTLVVEALRAGCSL